jgi:hypothetical protein
MLLASTSQSLGRSEERHQNIFNDKRKTFNLSYQYLILFQRSTVLGPGISRLWNSLIFAATRADISWSRRSAADSVWTSTQEKEENERED